MADVYDLEEQERLDELKAWWKRNGQAVMVGVTVFLLAISGIQGWRYYQKIQAAGASVIYEGMLDAMGDRDVKKVREVAGQLMEKYSGTAYAPRAALLAAGTNLENGDAKSARAQLQWALDNAAEQELKDAARMRLAGIMMDEQQFADARKMLGGKHGEAFAGLFLDLRGDISMAEKKPADARRDYLAALEKLDKSSNWRNLVQMKLDALGDAK